MTESTNTDGGRNISQARGRAAYMFANTLKWTVGLALLLIIARFQFRMSRLNLDLLGFAVFALVVSGVVGFLASLIQWQKIEDRQAVSTVRR